MRALKTLSASESKIDTPAPQPQGLTTLLSEINLPGGGRPAALAKLGLRTVADALFNFPRDYEDFTKVRTVAELEDALPQTVRGVVTEVEGTGSRFGKSRVGVIIEDDAGDALRGTWFNQAFMRDKFKVGQRVQFSAKPRRQGLRWEMAHPRVAWLEDQASDPIDGLLPLYSLTEGITQYHLRRVTQTTLNGFVEQVEEVFSDQLLAEHSLLPIQEALRLIHGPKTHDELKAARRRFVFQELFVMQLALAARRFQQRVAFRAPELPCDAQLQARIERLLPFELTDGQQKAIAEVVADLSLDTPMNRLLQGDVGSGKTVVALFAMLVCVANGWQAALMAPTEILARQHSATLAKLLEGGRVKHRLLVGGQRDSERKQTLAELASGDLDLVIGTHAVVQDGVEFAKLGLAVIDEQHKFGVRQRAALRRGDSSPHYLVMTATPIPRTMTMTQFGDLDVSILSEMPSGRQPVSTYVVTPSLRERWWKFVREKLHEGRQAYVVTPLVEESESISATSVSEAFEHLTNGELADYRVGLLHGRMSPADKEVAMQQFRSGELQVLVSTTVIEVGVDVPNASVMVIASPERFGLSQLHQLRGRVGRGKHPGFCSVLAEEEVTEQADKRLTAFAKTTDGFELAEIDFKLRGPGDLFGAKQSGLPPLRIADLQRDRKLLVETRGAAHALFAADPGLKQPEHVKLRRQMLNRYGKALELGDVG